MSPYDEDEDAAAGRHGIKVIHKSANLTQSVVIVNVTIRLGFRNDKEAGCGAAGDYVRAIAVDERRHWVPRLF